MLEGISLWRGDGSKGPDGIGRENIVGRRAVYGQPKSSLPQRMRTAQAVGAQWRQA